jgi:hypothetical protein
VLLNKPTTQEIQMEHAIAALENLKETVDTNHAAGSKAGQEASPEQQSLREVVSAQCARAIGILKASNSDLPTELMIQAKGLNAPRLTPTDIDAAIKGVQYHVFPGTTTTVCCITLQNGSTVVGESACVSPENFDQEIGEHIAFKNARDKIWALEGYLLKESLNPRKAVADEA